MMSLQLFVCVKQTPSSTSVAVDSTGRIQTDLPMALNPLDEYAVEETLRLKERVAGSKSAALSLGAPSAEEALRATLALGIDSAVLLCDDAFKGGDSFATAYLLSMALRKLGAGGPGCFVLTGKQTNDGESGQVGPQIAAWLGWPSVTSVRKITEVSDASITVERAVEDGIETLTLAAPAVLSVTKEINEPRLPSLKGKMAAKRAAVAKWGASDLGSDASLIGLSSPCAVAKLSPVPSRAGGEAVPGSTPEEKAKNLAEKLKELKLL